MVPPEAPYLDIYTDTFIFFLIPLCKIIWINVHYFQNASRMHHDEVNINIIPYRENKKTLFEDIRLNFYRYCYTYAFDQHNGQLSVENKRVISIHNFNRIWEK